MIAGLRLLPKVQIKRVKMQNENHPQAQNYLNCSSCVKQLPKATRAMWNCGLIPPTSRTGPGFPVPGNWGEDPPICPGYLITLPTVIECARAKLHWEKGLLKERYEGEEVTGILLDSIEILSGAAAEAEAQWISENK